MEFVIAFGLVAITPSAFLVIATVRRYGGALGGAIALLLASAHAGFWWWVFHQDLKSSVLSNGLVWYAGMSILAPIGALIAMRYVGNRRADLGS